MRSSPRHALVATLAASVLLAPLAARADAATTTVSTPPDIVRTKDGGFVRGTILESVPGDHVDIQLANGQTRRIAGSDVAYAGLASSAPAATTPPAPPPPAAATVPVKFEGDGADEIRLHMRVGEAEVLGFAWTSYGAFPAIARARAYASMCTAPCDARLPKGTSRLGLSARGGGIVEADEGVRIDGPSTLHGHYESYLGTRIAGWSLFAASILGGTVVMVTSRSGESCSGSTCTPATIDTTQLGVGAAIALVGGLLGVALGVKHDDASFTVTPLSVASLPNAARSAEGALPPEGLQLTKRF